MTLNRRLHRLAFALLALLGLSGCVTSSPEDMEKTISEGWIFSQGKTVYDLADIRSDRPVALFVHGCLGINGRQFSVMGMIDDNRFEVVMPDSFQRAGDRVTCRGQTMHLRYEDIDYALKRIRQVTRQPIVLVGFSEGGRAVAEYNGAVAVAGKAILGYDCYHGLVSNAPLLNIVGRYDDELRRGIALCPIANSHFVDTGHDVTSDKAEALLHDFMARVVGAAGA